MDKGRQERCEVDTAVVLLVRRQCRVASGQKFSRVSAPPFRPVGPMSALRGDHSANREIFYNLKVAGFLSSDGTIKTAPSDLIYPPVNYRPSHRPQCPQHPIRMRTRRCCSLNQAGSKCLSGYCLPYFAPLRNFDAWAHSVMTVK